MIIYKQDREIPICEGHQEKEKTPLIWTFAFPYNEYRCPSCGRTYGMLGVDREKFSRILHNRLCRYKEKSKSHLNSFGTLNCGQLFHKGKRIDRVDIPDSVINRHRRNTKKYKFKFKR